jgi:integrase
MMTELRKTNQNNRRRARDDYLTKAELEELFKACKDIEEKLLVCAAGQLGMRVGEIAHLSKSWIDFQDDRVQIPASMECGCFECRSKGGTWGPKTQAAIRSIPFKHFPVTREVLKAYFGAYDKVGRSRRALQLKLKRIARRAGLTKKVYPHALRSTAAMMFANAGLSAQALCEVMGWEDLRTAQSYIARSGRTAAKEIEEKKTEFVL